MYIGLKNLMIINSALGLNWPKNRVKKNIRLTKNLRGTFYISNGTYLMSYAVHAVWNETHIKWII